MIRTALLPLMIALLAGPALAGTGYEITSKKGDKSITYKVNFGGGRLFEQHTAYDPVSKSFIYLSWPRNEEAPKPAFSIWDHQTGRTIDLYKFPKVKHPLPVIRSIEAMKVCPKSGDRNFKSNAVLAYD